MGAKSQELSDAARKYQKQTREMYRQVRRTHTVPAYARTCNLLADAAPCTHERISAHVLTGLAKQLLHAQATGLAEQTLYARCATRRHFCLFCHRPMVWPLGLVQPMTSPMHLINICRAYVREPLLGLCVVFAAGTPAQVPSLGCGHINSADSFLFPKQVLRIPWLRG